MVSCSQILRATTKLTVQLSRQKPQLTIPNRELVPRNFVILSLAGVPLSSTGSKIAEQSLPFFKMTVSHNDLNVTLGCLDPNIQPWPDKMYLSSVNVVAQRMLPPLSQTVYLPSGDETNIYTFELPADLTLNLEHFVE